MPRQKPTQIALWNDLDIHFDGSTVRGLLDDGLSLRGYLSWTRGDTRAPVHGSLDAAAVAEGGGTGDYLAPITGTAIGTQLGAFIGRRIYIVGESVPPGAYLEAIAVTIVEDQGA